MTKSLISFLIASSALFVAGISSAAAETVTATTQGMTCEECASGIKNKLMKNDAVEKVEIDVEAGTVTVTIKEGATFSNEDLEEVIDWNGYEVTAVTRSA
ncbi:MAG: heavy-metal-associated domain-containing protein [bacterium]